MKSTTTIMVTSEAGDIVVRAVFRCRICTAAAGGVTIAAHSAVILLQFYEVATANHHAKVVPDGGHSSCCVHLRVANSEWPVPSYRAAGDATYTIVASLKLI